MTDSSPGNTAMEKPLTAIPPSTDDISDIDLHQVLKEKSKAQKPKEIVVRFDFNHYHDSSLRIAKAHSHILHEWQTHFPTIVIHNTARQKMRTIDLQSWGPEQHAKEFTIQTTSGKHAHQKCYSVLHRVTTQYSLAKLKSSVESILQKYKCRVTHHFWNEDEYDIMKIGHLIGLNPSHYSPSLAQQIVSDSIKLNGLEMPPFRLVFSTPSVITSNKENVRTKAYSFEIRKRDQAEAFDVLSKEPLGTLRILPRQIKYTNPSAYTNGLKLQNHTISNNYIIPVTGITREMMFYMRPYFTKIEGVQAVFPTQQTQAIGRWNVIVDKALFISTRAVIRQSLPTILSKVDTKAMPPAGTFSDLPTIPNMPGGTINGSFLTTSTQSFLTIDTASFALPTDDKPRTVYGSKSWSKIAQPTVTQPPTARPTVPPALSNTSLTSDNAKILEQLEAHRREMRTMQDQITKLEQTILLLTKQLGPRQKPEPCRPPPQQLHKPQPQQDNRPCEEKAKRDSSNIVHSPPKTPSKRQRAQTATPTNQDEEVQMDVSSSPTGEANAIVPPTDEQTKQHQSTKQSAKALTVKSFFDRYRAVAAD